MDKAKLSGRLKCMKIAVIFQLVFGLIGIAVSAYEFFKTPSAPSMSPASIHQVSLYFLPDNDDQSYYILSINLSYTILAFIGYPGYKYDKKMLIIFHAILTGILSVISSIYYGWSIIEEKHNLFIYILTPIIGIIVSSLGLRHLHFIWSLDESGEIPMLKESLISGKCICGHERPQLITSYPCGHQGVCERCAIKIKECPICYPSTL